MKKLIGLVVACAAALALSACASVTPNGLPSVNDEGQSPRTTTVLAADNVIEVMDALTDAANLGVLPDNFTDDIVQFAPDVKRVAGNYLDATAACIVIDGALQSDPATGRTCSKSVLSRTFGDLGDLLRNAALRAGVDTDTGRVIYAASIVLRTQLKPASGGVWSGYSKEPDVPLEQFNAMVVDLNAACDRLVAAAGANNARLKK